jgi:hypothetical protein
MSETSARFGLPFIMPGQAQKEVFHNEALTQIDALLQAAIEGVAASPPADAQPGQCWRVESDASGPWSGHADELAVFTSGGWRFIAPQHGTSVWNKAQGVPNQWNGEAWSDGSLLAASVRIGGKQVLGARQPAILSPSGGTIIDAETRASVGQIIVALKTHGLID